MSGNDKEREAEDIETILDVHELLPKCMRGFCDERRWVHPEKGHLVLCREHAEEVFRGEAKAPPLRRGIDYQSVARRTLLVYDLPKDFKK